MSPLENIYQPCVDLPSLYFFLFIRRLGYLIAYVSKVEREFWALAEGPWASEPGGGMQYRARWAATVRSTNGAADLAQSILQLESVLRPIAFSSSWFGEDKADGATGAGGGNTSHPGSRAMSRAPSMGDILQSGGGGGASGSQAAIENEGEDGDAGGSQARGQTSADPYDIRFEKLVMGGWEMDRRSHAAHAARVNRLPRSLLKKVSHNKLNCDTVYACAVCRIVEHAVIIK